MLDRVDIGFIGLAAVVLLTAIRVPLAAAIGLVSFFGIAALTSFKASWGIITSIPFSFVGDWSLSAIPMFLLMGFLASRGGLTTGLFDAMRLMLGRVPGGLACASVGACALFASASGSSVATSAAMGRISIPEMLRSGYQPALAAGTVATAGTLGSLIPPSVLMVVYGIIAEQPIGDLFAAGIVPGIVTALAFMGLIVVRAAIDPALAPAIRIKATPQEWRRAIFDIWPLPVLILGVMGGIFIGVFTPTEAGAVGASLALVIALARRGVTWNGFLDAVYDTVEGTSTIFIVAVSAAMFTRFIALSGMPGAISEGILSISSDQTIILIVISMIMLILGCFIDGLGIILLTMPVLLPILDAADINLVWFGILLIKLIEIGLVTPPVGLNVYIIKSVMGETISLGAVFRGAMWFAVTDVVVLALLIAFPMVTLYLPALLRGAE